MPVWRNWIAHQTSNLGVVGSSPTWGKRPKIRQQIAFPSQVKGDRLKLDCSMLRGFKSHRYH